ncbi:hypothetical protein [Mycoplasma suis]|uniref:Uncharacterized protein n=1 Tax=Mycoplasma suis (strain Illinois) TaxID=768700 RepID=F0QQI2_MYCSL|nr:hypothetical protein [Mycoplasma suis]ADX97752.1 hypothetical protein MSU_0208 [Mycoplasma suis str. Illinois]
MFGGLTGYGWTGYGWTAVLGTIGAISAGSYGVISYFGGERVINEFLKGWKVESETNEKITSGEYIRREYQVSGDRKGDCKKWINKKLHNVELSECNQKIQNKWGQYPEKQPEVWFSADKNSIEEVLKEHFSEDRDHSFDLKNVSLNSDTFLIGHLKCSRQNSENIEVSCFNKDDGAENSTN